MTQKTKKILLATSLLLLGGYIAYSLTRKKPKPQKKKPAVISFPPLENLGNDNPPYVYTKSNSNLRETPSTSARIVKTYQEGVTMYVTSSGAFSDGNWWEVNDGEGNSGWMRADVVTIPSEDDILSSYLFNEYA
jgi:uncharacterized protein YgiM (DUF1202 family)